MKMVKFGLFILVLLPTVIICKIQNPKLEYEEYCFDKKESLIAYLNKNGISEKNNAKCQDFFSARNQLTIPFSYPERADDQFHCVAKKLLDELQDLKDGEKYYLTVWGPIKQGFFSKIFSILGMKSSIDYQKPYFVDIKLATPNEYASLSENVRHMLLYTGPLP